MKNLKIKFGLFSLLAILAVSVFLTSCEQEIIEAPVSLSESDLMEQRVNEMISDADYHEFDRLQHDLLNQVFEVLDRNDIVMSELHSIYVEDGGERLNEIFSDASFLEIQQELSLVTEKLTAKYGDILAVEEGMEVNYTIGEVLLNLAEVESNHVITMRDCSWRYTLCTVAATSVYTACVAAISAGSGGVGAGLAFFACSSVYTYALTECHRKHCD